ncbi:competence protein CoiA family protein [Staphylococcus saccharolyticus]|uniref:competence protein CoiA family protein n=2 Tax=Staphylococcus saccharolyticus TaxID=33028 RepID=UPI003B75C420
MLVTMNQDGQRILAKNASKCQHYVCPYCKSSVVFKHGCSMIPHFAHKGRTKYKCIKTRDRSTLSFKIVFSTSISSIKPPCSNRALFC